LILYVPLLVLLADKAFIEKNTIVGSMSFFAENYSD
jgi:hypothetical protein